jgi:uncharacterized membrane protein
VTASDVLDRPDAPDELDPPRSDGERHRNPALASTEWLGAHAVVQRAWARRPRRAPVLVLAAAMTWWFITFASLIVWRHDRFGSFDFDLGVWDQLAWLFAHGGSLSTVRGLPSFGFHATPGLFLYAPFYWLGAGPNFLNVTMVGAVCLGAVPVFRLARHYLRNEWHALVPALAYLLNYSAQWLMQETWHPEVMAMPFLLFAFLAAVEGRWRAYAVWVALAIIWKEDIALALVMMGAVLAIRGRRTLFHGTLHRLRVERGTSGTMLRLAGSDAADGPSLTRRVGLLTMAACGAYFVFATQFWIPHFSAAGNFTEVGWFGDLGSRSSEILRSMITRPDLVSEHLHQSDPGTYFRELGGSFGFISLLSPLPLLIGFPQATINLLTVQNFFWPTKVHYAVVPLVAITIASVEGLARFKQVPIRRFLLGVMAVATFFTAVSWGISPWSKDYRTGYWPLEESLAQPRIEQAVARPGPDDAVSAMYLFVPHMTHRFEIYTFPNPWIANNWGVDGENRPDPDTIDWIIVNPAGLGESDRGVLASALTDPTRRLNLGEQDLTPPPAGEIASMADPRYWTVVTNDLDLLVVHRVRS